MTTGGDPGAVSRLRGRSPAGDADAAAAPPTATPPTATEPAAAPSASPVADTVPPADTVPLGTVPAGPATAGRPRRAGLPPSVLIALLACAVLAALTVAVSEHNSRTARQRHHNAAVAASVGARSAIIAATADEVSAALSYDYRHLPTDFAAAEAGLTPSFKAAYIHDTTTNLTAVARKYRAITKASVVGAGVEQNTATTATVLVFVDQTSVNSRLANSRLDRSRARVTLQKINGHWLLNSLNTL